MLGVLPPPRSIGAGRPIFVMHSPPGLKIVNIEEGVRKKTTNASEKNTHHQQLYICRRPTMATSGTGRLALMSPRGRALSFLMLHGRLLTTRLPSVSYALVVFGLGGLVVS